MLRHCDVLVRLTEFEPRISMFGNRWMIVRERPGVEIEVEGSSMD
jgi:hypothetical protein